jgi:hypothetical protein
VLVPGERLIMPDRTPADAELSGTSEHQRGCFLECLPGLLAIIEKDRWTI